MKPLKFLIPLALLLTGCLTGPAGKDGATSYPHAEHGTLLVGDQQTIGTVKYWDLNIGTYKNGTVIQAWVRQGSTNLWQTPTWYLNDYSIRIIDDEKVDAGWEYKINVLEPAGN